MGSCLNLCLGVNSSSVINRRASIIEPTMGKKNSLDTFPGTVQQYYVL